MRKLRRMSSKTRKKRIRNEDIIDKLGITSLEDKLRENRLKQFAMYIGDQKGKVRSDCVQTNAKKEKEKEKERN